MIYDKFDNRLTCGTVMGRGDLQHNNCEKNTSHRDSKRKDWNIFLVHEEVTHAFDELFGEPLARYNEKQIKAGRPGRCKTMDEWMSAQLNPKNKSGKKKLPFSEYIIRFGNIHTACAYVYKCNEQGRMVDRKGNVIEPWETDKTPVPVLDEHGNPIQSKRYAVLTAVLKECLKDFQNEFPELRIINAVIHADERGGIHMHVDVVHCYDLKNGIGYGCSPTTSYQRICDRLGLTYKDNKKQCAENVWRRYWREHLISKMKDWGLEWVDGKQSGRKKLTHDEFEAFADYKTDVVRKQVELNKQVQAEQEKNAKVLAKREAEVEKKEASLASKENSLNVREQSLERVRQNLENREASITAREGEINTAKTEIELKEQALSDKESEITAKKEAAEAMKSEAEAMKSLWFNKVADAETLYKNWNKRTEELESKAKTLKSKADKLKIREDTANKVLGRAEWVEKNLWIIKKVLETHPEWLKEREQEATVEFEKIRRKCRRVGIEL